MEQILKRLREKGMSAKEEWINKIGADNKNPEKEFIEADIEDSSSNLFEEEQNEEPFYQLNIDVVFQVNEIVDISLPFYQRAMFEQSPNGTLKMLLKQGTFICIALSKTDIQNLSVYSNPGIKILIKKGSAMRYGVFLLNNENCVVLGGFSQKAIDHRRSIHQYSPTAVLSYTPPNKENSTNTKTKTTAPKRTSTKKKENATEQKETTQQQQPQESQSQTQAKTRTRRNSKKEQEKPKLTLNSQTSTTSFLDNSSDNDDIDYNELEKSASQQIENRERNRSQNQEPNKNTLSTIENKIKKADKANIQIKSIDKCSLIRKGNDMMFAIDCILSNNKKIRIDQKAAEDAIGCSAKECISLPQEEMMKRTNQAVTKLVGKEGHLSDGIFYLD